MASEDISENDEAAIRKLADILGETNLSEIEVERDGLRIRVARQLNISAAPAVAAAQPAPAAAPAPAAKPTNNDSHPGSVKSPMVGTAYLSPAPNTPQFIDIGSVVQQGQTIMIVEAMKTMNNIPAPKAGRITEILIEDGQPVEYGEPLVIIE